VCLSWSLNCTTLFRRSVRNLQVFDSGSESSRSLKPHTHLSSGIRPTEQPRIKSEPVSNAQYKRGSRTSGGIDWRQDDRSKQSPVGLRHLGAARR
jgi:hypothetical protein